MPGSCLGWHALDSLSAPTGIENCIIGDPVSSSQIRMELLRASAHDKASRSRSSAAERFCILYRLGLRRIIYARRQHACDDSCDLRPHKAQRKRRWSRSRRIRASDERHNGVSPIQGINRGWRSAQRPITPDDPPKGFECNREISPTDEPLGIVSMHNSEDHPDEKSQRCHPECDEIVS